MKPTSLLLVPAIAVMAMTASTTDEPMTLKERINRFAPAAITADVMTLTTGDRQALTKLIEASRIMDTLYLRQVWSGNEAMERKLAADHSQDGKDRYQYFLINRSPWSSLDDDKPFIEGAPSSRPPGANYYPEDMTKEEFSTWLSALPAVEREQATGFFYAIRRDGNGKLKAIPYNHEYRDHLERAANLLREASALTSNTSLASFLAKRADAFLTNDYYESDIAWMDLDSPIEPTIGPYEVYMDRLFNYKAAFESFITLRNDEETAKLVKFSQYLQDIEDNLPIKPEYRNPKLGASSPIRVVDVVVVGGEARAGVQTAAYNLPNDERVTNEKGSKRVMLKNVQEAKFAMALRPIAKITISPNQQSRIGFEPFFTHILAHELMHGLGPHAISVRGKESTVRQELKELYSAFEEAKADISGLFALQFLIDRGVIEKSTEEDMYVTFLAGVFRSIRFGINEAHGRGMALQFNYLVDQGALRFDPATETFNVDIPTMKEAVKKLTAEIMTIQAEGEYDKAKSLLDKYAVIRPQMKKMLDKLNAIPVDIRPSYPLAD